MNSFTRTAFLHQSAPRNMTAAFARGLGGARPIGQGQRGVASVGGVIGGRGRR